MSAVVEEMIVPYHQTNRFSLYEGDCRIVLPILSDCSVDSIVCDPPYHLTQVSRAGSPRNNDPETPYGRTRIGERGFMGKTWDGGDVAHDPAVWGECLRVLKPGGHLIAFGGSRTYHRLACAIEDAGFEIRDQIMWLYGSGFPKSLNVARSIDSKLCSIVGRHFWSEAALPKGSKALDGDHVCAITVEGLEHDAQGTALKPAHEPIVLARKPLIGTVAENVLQHGTGGLNIDTCRIEGTKPAMVTLDQPSRPQFLRSQGRSTVGETNEGRWPSNIILDGSEEVLAGFPDAPGQQGDLSGHSKVRLSKGIFGDMKAARDAVARLDSGSAARFFYAAKASQEDRNEGCDDLPHRVSDDVHKRPRTELNDPRRHGVTPRQNNHPTVKPTDLMRYLCRLITPPGGLVLDPFCGSGSTGKAAMLEGFRFVGIELSADYCQLAQRRIEAVTKQGLLFA